jgi:hypothetical protein
MSAHRKDRHGDLVPAIVAGLIALICSISIYWMDFGPGADAQGSGNGMITASVLSRAGAVSFPTEPPVQLAIRKTVAVSETLTH